MKIRISVVRRLIRVFCAAAAVALVCCLPVSCVPELLLEDGLAVSGQKYERMLSIVDDMRGYSYEQIMTIDGYLKDTTDKFTEILGDSYTQTEKDFCDCCYYAWYAEYQAKRYDWFSENSGLLNGLYKGKAKKYREYADTLYQMLVSASTDADLSAIRIYCVENKIVSSDSD